MPEPLILDPYNPELSGLFDNLWEAVKPFARNLPGPIGTTVRGVDDRLTAQNQARRAEAASTTPASGSYAPVPSYATPPAPVVDVQGQINAALAQQQAQFQQVLAAQQQPANQQGDTILGMPKNTALLMGGGALLALYLSRQ